MNESLTPYFKRTTRSLQERFGGIEDISELPKEYIELERKVDALRVFYKKTLSITQQYEIESYDYPPNLKESIFDVTKTVTEKFHGLSQATTTAEAEAVLTSSSEEKHYPKTFAHSFSKVCAGNRETLISANVSSSLVDALIQVSEMQFKVGDERLEQDKLIITQVNGKLAQLLNTQFKQTDSLRSKVEDSRLNFDYLRSEIKAATKGDDTVEIPEPLNQKLEESEDDLVNATELAVESMKKLISPVESINVLKVLTRIQLNYHQNVAAELSTLAEKLDGLPVEDEDKIDS